MKNNSIFFSVLFAATAFGFFANCSGDKQEQATESHEGHAADEHASDSPTSTEPSEPQFEVDKKFQEQLSGLFTSYVELKDAFVTSDADKVRGEAQEAEEVLGKVDMKLLSGAAHNDWMNFLSPIQASLKNIQASGDIEAQRKAFNNLSDKLYKSVKAFGLGGKEAFYDYCPMAFNNEGAYWLSDEPQIRNPYFGAKMLTCGEVKEKLK